MKGQVASDRRGIWNGEKGRARPNDLQRSLYSLVQMVSGMNYAIQNVMTNGYVKKSVLTTIQKTDGDHQRRRSSINTLIPRSRRPKRGLHGDFELCLEEDAADVPQ